MDASPPSGRNLLRLHHLKRQLCFQIVGESVETAFSRCASSPDDRESPPLVQPDRVAPEPLKSGRIAVCDAEEIPCSIDPQADGDFPVRTADSGGIDQFDLRVADFPAGNGPGNGSELQCGGAAGGPQHGFGCDFPAVESARQEFAGLVDQLERNAAAVVCRAGFPADGTAVQQEFGFLAVRIDGEAERLTGRPVPVGAHLLPFELNVVPVADFGLFPDMDRDMDARTRLPGDLRLKGCAFGESGPVDETAVPVLVRPARFPEIIEPAPVEAADGDFVVEAEPAPGAAIRGRFAHEKDHFRMFPVIFRKELSHVIGGNHIHVECHLVDFRGTESGVVPADAVPAGGVEGAGHAAGRVELFDEFAHLAEPVDAEIVLSLQLLIDDLVADAPEEDRGVVAVASDEFPEILAPCRLKRLLPAVILSGPLVECLGEDQQSHFVGKFEILRRIRMVGQADRIDAE